MPTRPTRPTRPTQPGRRRFDPAQLAAAAAAQRSVLASAGLDVGPEADDVWGLVELVVRGLVKGTAAAPAALRIAVRALADRLATEQPGRSVEVRIPPYAAVQCIAGPRHTRGTPPNVVETDPATFVGLACGFIAWADAVGMGTVHVSGERADLGPLLPLDERLPTIQGP
jgi:hypothetical protein